MYQKLQWLEHQQPDTSLLQPRRKNFTFLLPLFLAEGKIMYSYVSFPSAKSWMFLWQIFTLLRVICYWIGEHAKILVVLKANKKQIYVFLSSPGSYFVCLFAAGFCFLIYLCFLFILLFLCVCLYYLLTHLFYKQLKLFWAILLSILNVSGNRKGGTWSQFL